MSSYLFFLFLSSFIYLARSWLPNLSTRFCKQLSVAISFLDLTRLGVASVGGIFFLDLTRLVIAS